MQFNKIEPPGILAAYVRYFWTFNYENRQQPEMKLNIMADGLPGLIFQHDDGRSAFEECNGSKLPTSFIYGQATNACTNYTNNHFSATG